MTKDEERQLWLDEVIKQLNSLKERVEALEGMLKRHGIYEW